MKQKLLLLFMALTTLGGVKCYAYDSATAGTTYSGSKCDAYGLDDGTVAIYKYYPTDGQTEVTFPATIQVWKDEVMTAEYEVSAVGVSGWNAIYFGSTSAYQYNGTVTSLIFSKGIKTINAGAFYEMTSLTSVQLPSTLTTIGDNAFTACDNLTSLTIYAESLTLGTDALKGKSSWDYIANNCVVRIPDGCLSNYKTSTWSYWDSFYSAGNIHELSYPKMSTVGYATYYNEYGYTMPEKIEGYVINWTYGGTANLVKVYDPGKKVAPKIPLLWKSTETVAEDYWPTVEAYTYDASPASWPTFEGTNQLAGSQTEVTTTAWGTESSDYYYYKLANNAEHGLGWYWGAAEGAAFTSAAHKCWLIISKSAGTRGFIPLGGEDGTTGIDQVMKKTVTDGVYYNLQGQRVENPTKGLYIVNGKKVIIK